MEFKIENGPVYTTLRVVFAAGEQFRAEAGSMVSMSPTIEIEAKSAGKGILGSLKAAVGGESLFASLLKADRGPGEVVLAPSSPGDIIRVDLSGGKIFAQSGAYVAGHPGLELSTKGSLKAFVSGEDLFLQVISGNGPVFLSSYGAVYERTLSAGENYIVDTGHLVAFESSVQYRIKAAAKGLFSTFASGEMLVAEYSGPGKIWIQTRNLSAFANLIKRFLPTKN